MLAAEQSVSTGPSPERRPDDGQLLFVVGTQRSGTTLLCRMLSAHSTVYVKNEIGDVIEVCATKSAPEILQQLNDEVMTVTNGVSLTQMQAEGVRWLGLKDPLLTYCLDDVVLKFPNSRFVFIKRDPRAVVRSYKQQNWGLAVNAYSGAQRWAHETAIQEAFCRKYPDRSIQLRYEDLLDDPRTIMMNICLHLGIAFEEAMLAYHEKQSEIKAHTQNEHAFKALDKSLAERWREGLTDREIATIETVVAREMEEFGYPRSTETVTIPPLTRAWYKWQQSVIGEIQIQYRWRVLPTYHRLKRSLGAGT